MSLIEAFREMGYPMLRLPFNFRRKIENLSENWIRQTVSSILASGAVLLIAMTIVPIGMPTVAGGHVVTKPVAT